MSDLRITTLESIGVRISVDSDGFTGTPAQGNLLAVDGTSGKEGKLAVAVQGDVVVAICQGYDSAAGILTYETVSPGAALAA